jgi:epoxyqueuosine reductase QueG
MIIADFIKENNIDGYGTVRISDITAPKGFHPIDIVPEAKSVIILYKSIPHFIFNLDSKVKSFYLYNLINKMDIISFKLSESLNNEGFQSIPIITFFPVKVYENKLKGIVSLKHLATYAGIGSMGLNTLLITPEHGSCICLTGVITEKEYETTQNDNKKELCLKCNRCLESCPTKAISINGVEITKCLNFKYPIPIILSPLMKFLMKSRFSRKYIELFINLIGWNTEMVCSKCMTSCPYNNDKSKCN